jgi:hypothetical protein
MPGQHSRMSKTSLLATVFVFAAAGIAHAGGQAGSVGLGAEYELNGIGGVSLNYDAGQFHVGGLLGFEDPSGPNNTLFELGGRFFYHVHKTAMADFGLGGNLGLASVPPGGPGMGQRTTDVFIEPGFEIRLFVASNVAISFMAGISIGVVDASGILITGQPTAAAGVHYYFF